MEAKVLMENDWVQQQNCTTPSQVAGVNGNKIYTYWADNTKHAKDAYYFDPIPLTTEILEKNGFERGKIIPSKFYRNIGKEQIMFCPYNSCYDLEYIHWNESNEVDATHHLDVQQPMKYVHELQHALRLCGLDELADNFKV